MLAELLLLMPVLMMFMLGVIEFYLMVETRIDLLNASRAGARVAASGGFAHKAAVEDEVRATVHRALGSGRLSKFHKVHVTWSQNLPPEKTAGEPDWVQVEVDVRCRCVIPDILGWLGFTLGEKKLVAGTLMKQE
jgi:Flp pilus assembly protein TadG